MAEDKKPVKKTKKDGVTKSKKAETMRESAAKSRKDAAKPKRVRKAAVAATKPVGAFSESVNEEYHLFDVKGDGFFTKSRKITPGYIRLSIQELKNVTWPGRKETWRLVFAVFVFAVVLGTVVAALDYGLEKVLREIIL